MAQPTRRGIVFTMTGAFLAELFARGQVRAQTPQPLPSPNAPRNQNVPAGLDGADIPVKNGQTVIPPATWAEIKSEAQKLLEMVTDFKKRVDQTNLSATLALPLVKEAHEIEKLAKKIQKQMKQ
jgi:hypothetical protein